MAQGYRNGAPLRKIYVKLCKIKVRISPYFERKKFRKVKNQKKKKNPLKLKDNGDKKYELKKEKD